MMRANLKLLPVLLLFAGLLYVLHLIAAATQNAQGTGHLYSWLILLDSIGLVVLLALILRHFVQIVQQHRARAPGARITLRLVVLFVLLALAPVSVVFFFSMQFLHRGIDAWFDVEIDSAMDDGLRLSQLSLDLYTRELVKTTENVWRELFETPPAARASALNDLRASNGAEELTLIGPRGEIVATSNADSTVLIPTPVSEEARMQVRQGRSHVALSSARSERWRVAVATGGTSEGNVLLHAMFPMPERIQDLADRVQIAYAKYKKLAFLRDSLKFSFTLALVLVLAFAVFSAVWAALYGARRLVEPLRQLADGTRAVADGDFTRKLPESRNDELGFLVRSFNAMTERLNAAREAERRSQRQVEEQSAYLQAVLGQLSSGVVTLDPDGSMRTINSAADVILAERLSDLHGETLERLKGVLPRLAPWADAIVRGVQANADWRCEVQLFSPAGRQILLCRGAPLGGVDAAGHVVVFDDVTALVQAQRDAAWGEAARRLAHEIKNPLTPIQLSAERLERRLNDQLDPATGEFVRGATHTIVQQVEAMKAMANEFADYARPTRRDLEPVNLNSLVRDVVALYSADTDHSALSVELDTRVPMIRCDSVRIRQVLHNVLKNAQEATGGRRDASVRVATECSGEPRCSYVEVSVTDNGPGFDQAIHATLFEPYVTTKTKGTGLGMAIVKKIIEEHGGSVLAENLDGGGARVTMRLPVATEPVASATVEMTR